MRTLLAVLERSSGLLEGGEGWINRAIEGQLAGWQSDAGWGATRLHLTVTLVTHV
jgi:hypothetical protein